MSVWAIADLHLAFGVPSKKMDVFGDNWVDYAVKIERHWREYVGPEDLVLLAGDICWATDLEEALEDLQWIDALPGVKVMIKGNHDYWWSSPSKIKSFLPPSIHIIQNDAFNWRDISIGGARLWDTQEYSFEEIVEYKPNPVASTAPKPEKPDPEKIFARELERLELSLKQLDQKAKARIVMTHYPPIGLQLEPSRASALLEKYRVDCCVFGHLHNVKIKGNLFGQARGVNYVFTASDYLNFIPAQLDY